MGGPGGRRARRDRGRRRRRVGGGRQHRQGAAHRPRRAARVEPTDVGSSAVRDRGPRRLCLDVRRRPAGEPPRRHAPRHHLAGPGDPVPIDWLHAEAYDLESIQLISLAYDGLVAYRRTAGAAGATLVGALATDAPEPSDDGRTYVFTLRPGVEFSNGAPVRPEDFRASIERFLQVTRTRVFPPYFDGIVGADSLHRGAARCDLSARHRDRCARAHDHDPPDRARTRSSCTSSTFPFAYVVPAEHPAAPRSANARRPAPGPTASRHGTPDAAALWSAIRTSGRRPRRTGRPGSPTASRSRAQLGDARQQNARDGAWSRSGAAPRTSRPSPTPFGSRAPARPHPGARDPRARADAHLPRGRPQPHVPERAAAPFDDQRVRRGAQLRHRPGPRCRARGRARLATRDVPDPAQQAFPATGRTARTPRTRARGGHGPLPTWSGRARWWTSPARPASASSSRSRSSSATPAVLHGPARPARLPRVAARPRRLVLPGHLRTRGRACSSDSTAGPRTTRARRRSSSRTSAAATSSPTSAIAGSCARSPGRDAAEGADAAARWAAIDRRVTDLAPAIPLTNRRSVDIVSPRVGNVQHHVTGYTLLEQLWVQ